MYLILCLLSILENVFLCLNTKMCKYHENEKMSATTVKTPKCEYCSRCDNSLKIAANTFTIRHVLVWGLYVHVFKGVTLLERPSST